MGIHPGDFVGRNMDGAIASYLDPPNYLFFCEDARAISANFSLCNCVNTYPNYFYGV